MCENILIFNIIINNMNIVDEVKLITRVTSFNFHSTQFFTGRPKILQLSNDSHLFKADILRKYNNEIEVWGGRGFYLDLFPTVGLI